MSADSGIDDRLFRGRGSGQKQDYTALCVVERIEEMYDEHDRVTWERLRDTRYVVRHMERVPLGTPYPKVVERICEVAKETGLRGPCELVVDATGVGGPVVDMLRGSAGCDVVAVTITGGDGAAKSGRDWRVPKRDLVIGLQVMFETEELRIAGEMRETSKFLKELMGMRVRISQAGHDSYGSWREGAHDDLVLAAALGCWRAKTHVRWDLCGSRPLPGM